MERPGEPRKRRSTRKPAEQAAQSLLAVLLLSTASGCATYDVDRSRPLAAKSRSYAQRPSNYIVVRGDTISSIARSFGVSRESVVDANNLYEPDSLRPGQRIFVPRGRHALAHGPERSPPIRTAEGALPKARGRSLMAPRDLDEAAEGLDPRIEGARFYAFDGPRVKPNDNRVEVAAPAEQDVDGTQIALNDLDAPYDPKKRGNKSAQVSRSGGQFIWPVQGRVISGFGPHNDGMHNDGINIAAEPGAPVKAAEGGVVVYAGNELASYGYLLLIRHPSGYVTAYAHNRRLLVKKNDKVKRGQLIASVGSTGDVDRPQLHFEIRRGEKAVDPRRYLTTATASR